MKTVLQTADIAAAMIDDAAERCRKANEMADGLTALATFVRDNPDLFAPWYRSGYPFGELLGFIGADHGHHDDQRATLAALARAAARAGLPVTKNTGGVGDHMFGLKLQFGVVTLRVLGDRDEVCERVVTGVETVTKTVPDPDALAAVPTVEVTETVEQVEWRCGPLLGAESPDADR